MCVLGKRGKREICVTGVEPLSDKEHDSEVELKRQNLKDTNPTALLLPAQVKVLDR